MKRKSPNLPKYRYITIYSDRNMYNGFCEFVHFAVSLPLAIKAGREFVRVLNRDELCRPGMKRYHYESTYRAR